MEPSEAGAARQVVAPADRLQELSASARGWHTIQMAVLGFIGICGVLRTTSSPSRTPLMAPAPCRPPDKPPPGCEPGSG
jgi:hypothetical protein